MATMPTRTKRPSPNPAGRTPSKRCVYGHDMGVTRRRRANGETYCAECRKARNRFSYRLPRHVSEMRDLLRDGLSLDAAGAAMQVWQRRVFEFFGRVRG